MWKPFADYLLDLLNTARETRANKVATAELRSEMAELALAVERLSAEVRHQRENQVREQEKLLLQVENFLLRRERLPAPKPKRIRRKKP